jgi:radical SAM-linked protein
MQCLRLKFFRGEEIKYISHLSLMRLWERALRRAEVPLAYSEGFSPHPKLSLAAPLPIGVTSEAELMDIILNKPFSPYSLICNMAQQLPHGIDIIEVQQLPLGTPSLQSQLRYAEYRVEIKAEKSFEEMQSAIVKILRTESLPWQHMRDTGMRHYDLRALIEHLWVVGWHGSIFTLGMRLRCGGKGSGRPEQVTLALGMTDYPYSIHRTRLLLV